MPAMTWEQLVALQQQRDLPDTLGLRFVPAWHDRAACTGSDANFFPRQGEDVRPAKAVCAGCPVKAECLAYALEQGPVLVGIWAGTSARDRRQMRGRRAEVA